MPSYTFAHLSDLHFFKPTTGIKQFFSKRWVGNFNFVLRRKADFQYHLLDSVLPILSENKVPLVVISGDVSCTSLPEEFYEALLFVQKLKNEGIEVIILPGNHDQYTKHAFRNKLFYDTFPSDLQKTGLEVKQLSDPWWLIALDTTIATPLFCCHGKFSEKLERQLDEVLTNLPENAHVILANHFPIALKTDKALQREKHLLTLIKKHPKVKIYLHGHTHKQRILDQRKKNLPIIVDSGSVAHKRQGGWNLFHCEDSSCSITPFQWKESRWATEQKHHFTWDSYDKKHSSSLV